MLRTALGNDASTVGVATTTAATLLSQQALVQTLQRDGDALRQRLESITHERDRLRAELEETRTRLASAEQRASVAGAQVDVLQKRCQCLAERLVTSVQDGQFTQSAEVYFLLRAQQEERVFLRQLLCGLCREFAVGDVSGDDDDDDDAAAGDAAGADGIAEDVAVHTSALSAQLMKLATRLRAIMATRKLTRAQLRFSIGRAGELVTELRQSIERVARTLFALCAHDAHGSSWGDPVLLSPSAHPASHVAHSSSTRRERATPVMSATPGGGGDAARRSSWMRLAEESDTEHRSTMYAGQVTSDGTVNSHAPCGRNSLSTRTENRNDVGNGNDHHASENGSWVSVNAGLPRTREEDAHWCCDVLKACLLGMDDLQRTLQRTCRDLEDESKERDAASEQTSRRVTDDVVRGGGTTSALPMTRTTGCGEGGGVATDLAGDVNGQRSDAAVERLLRGFMQDVDKMVAQCTASQERLARRVAREVSQHQSTMRHYEARLRLLTIENSKLLLADVIGSASAESVHEPVHSVSGAATYAAKCDDHADAVGDVAHARSHHTVSETLHHHHHHNYSSPRRASLRTAEIVTPLRDADERAEHDTLSVRRYMLHSPRIHTPPHSAVRHVTALHIPMRRSVTVEPRREASTPHSWRVIRDGTLYAVRQDTLSSPTHAHTPLHIHTRLSKHVSEVDD